MSWNWEEPAAGVVEDAVEHHPDPPRRRRHQRVEAVVAAEQRVDLEVVVGVVAVVGARSEDGIEVDGVDPQVLDPVEPLDDPDEVASLCSRGGWAGRPRARGCQAVRPVPNGRTGRGRSDRRWRRHPFRRPVGKESAWAGKGRDGAPGPEGMCLRTTNAPYCPPGMDGSFRVGFQGEGSPTAIRRRGELFPGCPRPAWLLFLRMPFSSLERGVSRPIGSPHLRTRPPGGAPVLDRLLRSSASCRRAHARGHRPCSGSRVFARRMRVRSHPEALCRNW